MRPEARSSPAGFLLCKMSPARSSVVLLGTKLPGPSCPFPDTQKPDKSPDHVPGRLSTGPIPLQLRLPTPSPGSLGSAAGGKRPRPPQRGFLPLPPSPPLVITSTRGPATIHIYIFLAPSGGGWRGKPPRSAPPGEEGEPTHAEAAAARPQRRAPAGLRAARLFHARFLLPRSGPHLPHTHPRPPPTPPPPRLPGFPEPTDKGSKSWRAAGRRRPRGWRGAAGGRYRGGSLPVLPAVFRRSATPGSPPERRGNNCPIHHLSDIKLDWVFLPPFVTDSIHITNSESPIGIIRIEPFCKSG